MTPCRHYYIIINVEIRRYAGVHTRGGTEEGSGREKVSTEHKRRSRPRPFWQGPILLALPFAAALIFAAAKWGTLLKNLIHVAIKMAVIS